MPEHSRRAMTPQDITRIRFISDPQLSPDGRRVAFVVTTLSEDQDEYLSNIWMVDTTGGEPRRFTTGPKRDTAPRWSPDGSRLAFVSEREAKQKAQLRNEGIGDEGAAWTALASVLLNLDEFITKE